MMLFALLFAACFPTVSGDGDKDDPVDTAEADADTDADTDADSDTDTDTDTDSDTDADTDADTDSDTDADTDADTDTDTGPVVDCSAAGAPPNAGDLVITEIMKNPDPTADEFGEWLEIHNASAAEFDLCGLVLSDLGTDSQTIASSVRVPPGGYAVIGRSADTATNGGVTVHYALSGATFQLGNNDDEVVISGSGGELDSVVYTTTAFPDTKGRSMQLQVVDAASNDVGANWCHGTATYGGDGNVGTPGAPNDACAPVEEPPEEPTEE